MYDYVIVGAGSAGCVLAARLSEDPDVSVCLVEAGPADTNENIHIPVAFGKLFRSALDWDYDTGEEPALGNRRIYLPRGRVLGGSGSLNTMIYARGNPLDFDGWGVPGWGFSDVLPYFLKAEDNERGESEFHGVGGPLRVADGRSKNPMSAAFVEAALQAGYGANEDFNAGPQDGFGFFQLTQRDGRRYSTASGYLHPVWKRPNLTVLTNVTVHRVLLEGDHAAGIKGYRLDDRLTLRAEREVILCAGAYNTPQLLMLSGIGPAEHLSMLDIPVTLDQPAIGTNLQDHPLVPLIYTHPHPVSTLTAGEPRYVREFEEHGTGPMTSNGPEAGGFVRTRPGLD